jgi:hypothetical protein
MYTLKTTTKPSFLKGVGTSRFKMIAKNYLDCVEEVKKDVAEFKV